MKNLFLIAAVSFTFFNASSQSLDSIVFEELNSYTDLKEFGGIYPYFGTPYKNNEGSDGVIYNYEQPLDKIHLGQFFSEVERVLTPHGLSIKLDASKAKEFIDAEPNKSGEPLYVEFFYFDDVRVGYKDFVCVEIRNGGIGFYVGYEK